MAGQDYYNWALSELLYKPGLTEMELKKKYRELSKEYHPDMNPDVDLEKFKAISRAYDDIKKKKVNPNLHVSSNKNVDDTWSNERKEAYRSYVKNNLHLENMSTSDLKDFLYWDESELMSLKNAYNNYLFKRNEVRIEQVRYNQQMINLEKDLSMYKALIKPSLLMKWVEYSFGRVWKKDLPFKEVIKSIVSASSLITVLAFSFSKAVLPFLSIGFIAYNVARELKNNHYQEEVSSIQFIMDKTDRALEDLRNQELSLTKEVSYYSDKKNKKEIERDLLKEELDRRTKKNSSTSSYSWETQTEYGGYQYHK